MFVFYWIVGVLFGAVLLAALARRLGAPYPAFLALGGAGLAFLPGVPNLSLDPDLALANRLGDAAGKGAHLPIRHRIALLLLARCRRSIGETRPAIRL